MKFLNIGCGKNFHPDWINIDLESHSPQVKKVDIRKGLPFEDDSIDYCYSSHVLEHLDTAAAESLLKEMWRVLRPGGAIRLVVPDLEIIAKDYLKALDKLDGEFDQLNYSNYEWTVIQLLDQMVREKGGGKMSFFWRNMDINKDYVLQRAGLEAKIVYENSKNSSNLQKTLFEKILDKSPKWYLRKTKLLIIESFILLVGGKEMVNSFRIGTFRNSGEVHKWMYDRHSLKKLLIEKGFTNFQVCQANESRIPDFNKYCLDVIDGAIRKPDSIFVEGIKVK